MNFKKKVTEEDFMKIIDGLEKQLEHTRTRDNEDVFDEITSLANKCRYSDCTHVHEPGCKVLSFLKAGKLNEKKYSNYINLKNETEYYEANKTERREKERKFGKFLKTAKKELKKYK